ncbi:MAG: DNA polymerase III subunit beta [Verrucomicrobia bacterium]|nr:DNA polymerase III subunit beta [Verrucomicrobiota bacterium]
MKLAIGKDQLMAGLQTVQNIVGTRTTLPVLSNVLLRAHDGILEFKATDMDVSLACSLPADIGEDGDLTLPVKRLFGIVRELPPGDVDLESDEKHVAVVRSGATLFKIHGLAAEEFPPIQPFVGRTKLSLVSDRLKSMLKKTSFAVSTDETRFVLNGIYCSLRDQKLTMVATDGRRLALTDEEVDVSGDAVDMILPIKAINELSRLLQPTGQVEIQVRENQAAFRILDEKGFEVMLITRLVEGNYPNYRQVIPSEAKERIRFAREELAQALRRAQLMTSDKSNSVKLAFSLNNLAITANTPEIGESRESIAIQYEGKEFAIAFNPTFLLDPLRALEDEEIFLELTDELSPGVVKIRGPFLYVIMPMRMT